MQNEQSTTFLRGQKLKAEAESFTPITRNDWLQIQPLVPKITTSAKQVEDQMVVGQEKANEAGRAYKNAVAPNKTFVTLPSTSTLKPKQSWEGVVINCMASRFIARIIDRTNPSNPEEIAEFESEEISDDDRPLIKPGASFYWTLGTERSPAGQIKNIAIVNFRRTPRWNRTSIKRAKDRAEEIAALFG